MLPGFVGFDRVRSQEEMDQLIAKAKEDNHGVFIPTHPLRKDGELVGYFSIGHPGAILVFAWLSTKELGARDSFSLINAVEGMVAGPPIASGMICWPIPENSPFFPLMEKLGYKDAGSYHFFIKNL